MEKTQRCATVPLSSVKMNILNVGDNTHALGAPLSERSGIIVKPHLHPAEETPPYQLMERTGALTLKRMSPALQHKHGTVKEAGETSGFIPKIGGKKQQHGARRDKYVME